jgi:hypothetical protein
MSPSSLFIEYVADGKRTARDQELLDSSAKAHAARYAHQKRKKQQALRRPSQSVSPVVKDESSSADSSPQARSVRLSRASSVSGPGITQPNSIIEDSPLSTPLGTTSRRPSYFLVGASVTPQSFPVSLDSSRFRAIEYFPELWSRWAADVIPYRAERRIATSQAVSNIVQRCLFDDLHMDTFMSYVLQRAPGTQLSKVSLLETAGKALAELRHRIESGHATLEEVVWPIIYLCHFELFGSKSVAAGRAHLKAIVDLGGMEHLDEVTKAYLRRMDRGWWSNYPSIFPRSTSPAQQWQLFLPDELNVDPSGNGFHCLLHVLGPDLLAILPYCIDVVRASVRYLARLREPDKPCRTASPAQSSQNDSPQTAEEEFLTNRIIHTCQTLMDSLRSLLPTTSTRTACIYPTMIWLQYTTWVMRDIATQAPRSASSVQAYRKVTSHAHPNLLAAIRDDATGKEARELRLWAAAVGLITCAETSVRREYAKLVLSLARKEAVPDLRGCWVRFIWFEEADLVDFGLLVGALDEIVEEAVAGAKKRNQNVGGVLREWGLMRRLLVAGTTAET